jgi:ubiquinone/menaquinone biosynthesis C-methylase UbiE
MHDIHTASDRYAERFSGPIGAFFDEIEIGSFLGLLGRWPGCRVLDVGGGHARMAVPMTLAGYRVTVTGSDSSCRMRLDRFLPPGSFDFVESPTWPLPFDQLSFDIVVATRLLAHEEQWQLLIAEMCRVAKLAVIFDYPPFKSSNFLARPLFHLKKRIEKSTRTFRVFYDREITTAVDRCGFREAGVTRQFLMPMVLHRWIKSARFSRASERSFARLGLTARFGSPVLLLATRCEPVAQVAGGVMDLIASGALASGEIAPLPVVPDLARPLPAPEPEIGSQLN